MSVYKMNESTTIRFIELYRSEECLWNTQHTDYKNKDARTQAAERIADRMNIYGFGPSEVTQKFKNIRSSYCHELKKINSSIRYGLEEVYKPKVVWFHIVDTFLRPFMMQQKENQMAQNDDTNGEMIEINDDELVKVESSFHFDSFPTSDTPKASPKPLNGNNKREQAASPDPPGKKQKIMDNPEYVTINNKMQDSKTFDEFDAFARFIATQLRELPIEHAIRAECKILQCLADARINYFKEHAAEKYD